MKILMAHIEFHPTSSGVARHMEGLARTLAKLGHEVEIHVPHRQADAPADAPYRVSCGGPASLLAAIRRADAVHVHGSRSPRSALAIALAKGAGRPAVYTPHCYYDRGGALVRVLKRLWDATIEAGISRLADHLIALDEQWIEDFRARGLAVRRCSVVPNCLDMEAIERRIAGATPERLAGAPAILSVGRLDPVKRIDDMISALALPQMADAVLHVVGQGHDLERLEAHAEAEGVSGRVRFHGWQDDGRSMAMMLGCDTMVLASEREGLPTTLLEALAAGVPMIYSDIPGNTRAATAVGWINSFPVGNRATLAAQAALSAGRTVPDHVRRAVAEHYSWQTWASRVAELYRG